MPLRPAPGSVGNIKALLRPDGQGTPTVPSTSVRPRDFHLFPPTPTPKIQSSGPYGPWGRAFPQGALATIRMASGWRPTWLSAMAKLAGERHWFRQ